METRVFSYPMSLLSSLTFIANHPLNRNSKGRALAHFLRWQIGSRLVPGRVIYDWVNGSKIIVRRGETGITGNLYCGLHEFADMAYLLHVLGAEDLFVDVGANVGSYTVLACAAKGARGYCFEPVPSTFSRLMDNLRINNLLSRVTAKNLGVSDRTGELAFTSHEDTMNHVVSNAELRPDAVRVGAMPLDDLLDGNIPAVIKIDVEGFEKSVLLGARNTLANEALHSVIMELNGSGKRYGFDDGQLVHMMSEFGFFAFSYEPFSRELQRLEGKNGASGNTLFIRGESHVRALLMQSPRILVGAHWL